MILVKTCRGRSDLNGTKSGSVASLWYTDVANTPFLFSIDHYSFQKEYISPRTLSFTGERTTKVAARKKHNVTHSVENEFGKRVQTDLIVL